MVFISLDLLFPFYCDNYLVWASVCRAWRDYIKNRVKGSFVTESIHVCLNIKIFKWSQFSAGHELITLSRVVKYGSLKLIRYFKHKNRFRVSDVVECAIVWERLDVLKSFVKNNRFIDSGDMYMAALVGNVELLKFLHEVDCEYDDSAVYAAAENGHINVLEWIYEFHGIESGFYSYAIFNNQIKFVEWLRKKKYTCSA